MRLNQNPSNSSRLPSTQAPRETTEETSKDDDVPQDDVPETAMSNPDANE
jgi:hypothetical protein